MSRWKKWLMGAVGVVLAVIVIGIAVLTQTDYGRNIVRGIALRQLAGVVNGNVEIGRISGNLLTGAVLEPLVITDSAGGPFLRVERAFVDYSIISLLSKRIYLSELRLERAEVDLDKQPGEDWNFARIFPSDTVAQDTTERGFGSWVRIENVQVADGTVRVRNEWLPDSTLSPAARDSAVRVALSPASRLHVVEVPGGYQSLHEVTELNAELPLLRLADPDSSDILIEVAALEGSALPFRPPALEIEQLEGRFVVAEDSLWFREARLALPTTRLAAEGAFVTESGSFRIGVAAAPIELADLQWIDPALPDSGGGDLQAMVARVGERTLVNATGIDLRLEEARVVGHAAVESGDSIRLGDTDLEFTGFDTRLVERYAPDVQLPIDGTLEGHLRLAGSTTLLDVSGWTTMEERDGTTSRITISGAAGSGDQGFTARNLRLVLEPVHVSLARTIQPGLPVGGAIRGEAVVDGSAASGFALHADLVHRDGATGASRLLADGGFNIGEDPAARDLTIRLQPVQLALVRAFAPNLAAGGAVSGRVNLNGPGSDLAVDADLTHSDVDRGDSRVLASGRLGLGDELAANDLAIRLQPLQASLVRAFAPDFSAEGAFAGVIGVDGTQRALDVDADLVHDGDSAGRSHLTASGRVVLTDGFSTPGLRIDLDPLQVALARGFSPQLPVGGTVSGWALVSGSTDRLLAADLDLIHQDVTGRSHMLGRAAVGLAEPVRVDLALRAPELALETVGRFVPAAGLQGDVTAAVVASGTLTDLGVSLDLDAGEGGSLAITGGGNLVSERARYDLQADFAGFRPEITSSRAPSATLTGMVVAAGSGTDPATAEATLQANLVDTSVGDGQAGAPVIDAANILARIGDGILTMERGRLQIASAEADVEGSFGLVAERSGTLRYRVAVDSLADFAALLPAGDDTLAVDSIPLQTLEPSVATATSIDVQPADSVASATSPLDSLPAADDQAPRAADSLMGSVLAEGVLAGNIERFDLRGSAAADELVVESNAVGSVRASYEWYGAPQVDGALSLDADASKANVSGFALDSVAVQVDHTGGRNPGSGSVNVAVFQDLASDYRLNADYQLALERSEVQLNDIALRFDTVQWRSVAPGVVGWGDEGIEVQRLELVDDEGGRIFADGRLPDEGSGDLHLEIERLQIADILTILQDTTGARGRLSLAADVEGTQSAPRFSGMTALTEAGIGDETLPDLQASFRYQETQLDLEAALLYGGGTLAEATAVLPVDLAITGVSGSRTLDREIVMDVRADSIPLDALPSFTDAVSDVEGIVRGNLALRGTFDQPVPSGVVTLDLGSFRIVEPGLHLRDLAGAIRIDDDTIVVDSLVARSEGPIRIEGSIDITVPSEPGFDIALTARDARILNNELGRALADADLTVAGPFEAVEVSGTANVREGTFYIPESSGELIDLSDPALEEALADIDVDGDVLPEQSPLLDNLIVDVSLGISRNTWVRNTEANVEIYTPDDEPLTVVLDNISESLALEGTISVDRGEYNFSGRLFELTSGTITFLGGPELNPLLQLVAVYDAPRPTGEPLTIQIGIGGVLQAPTLTLSSNSEPPLPESDLLSYLAFGQPSNSLLGAGGSGISGGGGVEGIGAMATQQLTAVALGALVDDAVSSLERSAGRSGLDVVRISPADDLPEEAVFGGAFENVIRGTEIVAGKYITPRLFLSAQGRPTTDSAPGLVVEYRTPQGFILRSTWEPVYLPSAPTFSTDDRVLEPSRVFGLFFNWQNRF